MTTNLPGLWAEYDETNDERIIREAKERIEFARTRRQWPEIELSGDAGDARYAELVDQVRRAGREGSTAIIEEMAHLLVEKSGQPAFGHVTQLGRRFTESARFRAWAAYGGGGMNVSVPVLKPDELGPYLAALNVDPGPLARTSIHPSLKPLPAQIASLVSVVPSERVARRVKVDPDLTGLFGGSPSGVASQQVPATITQLEREQSRWTVHTPVARGALIDDPPVAARVVDEVLRNGWARLLDVELLAGTGADVPGVRRQLLGILSAGIGSLAGPISVAKVLSAVQTLTTAGFGGPHDLIGPPAMLTTLLGAADWRSDRFPTIRSIRYVDHASVVVLGQWSEASLYVDGPVRIDVSPDHGDYFLRGLYTLQPNAMLTFDVPRPDAFVKIAAS
jgi:hypothetical protein